MKQTTSLLVRRLPVFVAALMALLVGVGVGCGTFGSKPKSRGLTRIVETGELRIGMSGEQPPLNMTARDGELFGMEVALMNVLAQSMGVNAVYVARPFGELLDALQDGEIDLVMSGMTITPERSTRATFVGPYFTSGKALLTKSEALAAAQIPADVDSDELRLIALAGSTSEDFAKRSLPKAKLDTTATPDEAIRQLLDGNADAMVADRETGAFAALRFPEAELLVSPANFTVEPMGIAVPTDQPQLASLLQTYLNALQQSGGLDRAREFWFKDPSWVKDLR